MRDSLSCAAGPHPDGCGYRRYDHEPTARASGLGLIGRRYAREPAPRRYGPALTAPRYGLTPIGRPYGREPTAHASGPALTAPRYGRASAAPVAPRFRKPPRYRPWSCPHPSHRALAMSIRGTWPSAERAASRSGVPSSR